MMLQASLVGSSMSWCFETQAETTGRKVLSAWRTVLQASLVDDDTTQSPTVDATKAAIIAASYLPMSIIIIGVGSVNFAPMEELDSDKQLLKLGSATAKRDIVQFVELNQLMWGRMLERWDKEHLAREVLRDEVKAEIYFPFLTFFPF